MAWNAPPLVTTGQLATAPDHNTYTRGNLLALRNFDEAGDAHDLGGTLNEYVLDTVEVDLPDSAILEIVGANLAGRTVYLEVTCRARMADGSTWSGSVTCTVDLYNVTAAAVVASSAVAVVLSSEAKTRSLSSAITLAAATNAYKARIKTSSALRAVAARVRVVIR